MSRGSPEELIRALADPERLAVAGLLARRAMTLAEVSSELGLPRERCRRCLSRLTSVGLAAVQTDRRTYVLNVEVLREAARAVGPPRDPGIALGAVFEEDEAILRQYFRAGRLREIPSKRSKRLVVLERLALEFEPGVRYAEREVNQILRPFHGDHVALRRYLVDEGFLTRERGEYWRTGGRVEVRPAPREPLAPGGRT
jgi:hypothetical protein